jgi:hypothetical protein
MPLKTVVAILILFLAVSRSPAQQLHEMEVHLRSATGREWSEFPETGAADHLGIHFASRANEGEQSLRLRQYDVKQPWRVVLNGKPLGDLVVEERLLVASYAVPAGSLRDGENVLRIEPRAARTAASDDIRVGPIHLDAAPLKTWLNEGQVEIEVVNEQGTAIPCGLSITDSNGALHPVGAVSNDHLAVRTGIVCTSTGKASFGLPAGRYVVTAGRGFEYSLAKEEIVVSAGETVRRRFTLRREAPLEGYAACDTHIHTLTFSGHGDCTIDERMITLAAEGIELPIATDHNVHIDFEPHARRMNVRQYFTPVMGNEVTTKVGHFNAFPIETGARIPDARLGDWKSIFGEVFATPGVKVVILNHARDLHSNVRPFGPALFNAAVAERLDSAPLRFNAMEVINSGATQTDVLRLFHDWLSLLNRGYQVTPVGSSDSHDVARHFVGQGRTYIRCDDRDPGQIDTATAIDNFLAGRVLVSYGLVADLRVNGKYEPGDFAAPSGDEIEVDMTVRGPHWIKADKVQLYANGQLLHEEAIESDQSLPQGLKWQRTWKIKRPSHDVHLAALAIGPGIEGPYWRTAKPYQPTSPDWTPQVFGISGAIWIDSDGDGRKSCARDYAERLWLASDKQLERLLNSLKPFDAAVASHAAHLHHLSGGKPEGDDPRQALKDAPEHVRAGFAAYFDAWRECELARQK